MSLEIIIGTLLHTYDNIMKAMLCHQTITGLQKNWPNKINESPCKICYTEKITTLHKGTTDDNINIQPGELILIDFYFYNVTSIQGSISDSNYSVCKY